MNEKNSSRSQGVLEYLVIVGTVLTIAAIAMIIISGAMGPTQREILFDQCSSAASRCNTRRAASPDSPCLFCEEQCVDGDGEPLFGEPDEINAIDCCMLGLDDEIFLGAGEEGDYEDACEPDLVADFTYSISGREVYFDASPSRFEPHHPNREITDYSWDVTGDGTEDYDNESFRHEYPDRDERDVELTVTDDRGHTDTEEKTVSWEGFFVEEGSMEVVQDEVYGGQEITIEAEIENVGEETETQEIELETDLHSWDNLNPSETMELDPGDVEGVSFTYDTDRNDEGFYEATISTEDDSSTINFEIYGNYSVTITSGYNGRVVEPGEGTFYYKEGSDVSLGAQADQDNFTKDETKVSGDVFPWDDLWVEDYYNKTDYDDPLDVSEALELNLTAEYLLDPRDDNSTDDKAWVSMYVDGEEVFNHERLGVEGSWSGVNGTLVDVSNEDEVDVTVEMGADAHDGKVEVEVYWSMHEPHEPGDFGFLEWDGDTDLIGDPGDRLTSLNVTRDDIDLKAYFQPI